MLVLSRQRSEEIICDLGERGLIRIMVVDIRGDKVRIGVDCDATIPVHRLEVWEEIKRVPA